jgi:hypothetical protein
MTDSARPAFRPYTAADEGAVLDLIAADRLPGQPVTTSAMLGEALAGRSPVDAGGVWARRCSDRGCVSVRDLARRHPNRRRRAKAT